MANGWGPFEKRPNIIIFMTDQQRAIQHFPKKWVEENSPSPNPDYPETLHSEYSTSWNTVQASSS